MGKVSINKEAFNKGVDDVLTLSPLVKAGRLIASKHPNQRTREKLRRYGRALQDAFGNRTPK